MRKISEIEPVLPALPERKKAAAYVRVSQDSERLMHSEFAKQMCRRFEEALFYIIGNSAVRRMHSEFAKRICKCRRAALFYVFFRFWNIGGVGDSYTPDRVDIHPRTPLGGKIKRFSI